MADSVNGRGRPISIRRPLSVLAVLLLAVGATVATSPASPPASTVRQQLEGTATLSAQAPIVSVPLRIFASDEALWSDDPEVQIREATVRFGIRRGLAVPSASARPTAQPPNIRVAVIDGATGRPVSSAVPYATQLDLLQSCVEFRDCELELRVILEAIEPAQLSEPTPVVWVASGVTVVVGPEQPPAHAAISIERAGADDQAVVALTDEAAESGIRLDAEHPLAIRRLRLRLSRGVASRPLTWPLEQRAVFSTDFESVGEEGTDDSPPPIRFALIPDGGQEERLEHSGVGTDLALQPFVDCAPAGPCETVLTARFEWLGDGAAPAGTVDWKLSTALLYHEGGTPAPDDSLEIEVEDLGVAGPEDAALSARTGGTLRVTKADRRRPIVESFTVRLNSAAIPRSDFADAPPSIRARLVVSVGGSELPAELPPLRLALRGERNASVELGVGEVVEQSLLLIGDCIPGRECIGTFQVSPGLYDSHFDAMVDTSVIVFEWSVEISMIYPNRPEAPAGAKIEIE